MPMIATSSDQRPLHIRRKPRQKGTFQAANSSSKGKGGRKYRSEDSIEGPARTIKSEREVELQQSLSYLRDCSIGNRFASLAPSEPAPDTQYKHFNVSQPSFTFRCEERPSNYPQKASTQKQAAAMTQSPTDSSSKPHLDLSTLPESDIVHEKPDTPPSTPKAGVHAQTPIRPISDIDDQPPKSLASQRKKAATTKLNKILTSELDVDDPHYPDLAAERKRAATMALGKVLNTEAYTLRSPPPLAASPPWSSPKIAFPPPIFAEPSGSPTDTQHSTSTFSSARRTSSTQVIPSSPSSAAGSRRASRAFLTDESPLALRPSRQTFRIAAEIEAGQHPDFHIPAPGSRRVSTVDEIDAKLAGLSQPPTRQQTASLASLERVLKHRKTDEKDDVEETRSETHVKQGMGGQGEESVSQDDDEEWESEVDSEEEDEWVGSGKGFWGHLTDEKGRFRGREHEGGK